jgi:hypothetical protein
MKFANIIGEGQASPNGLSFKFSKFECSEYWIPAARPFGTMVRAGALLRFGTWGCQLEVKVRWPRFFADLLWPDELARRARKMAASVATSLWAIGVLIIFMFA